MLKQRAASGVPFFLHPRFPGTLHASRTLRATLSPFRRHPHSLHVKDGRFVSRGRH